MDGVVYRRLKGPVQPKAPLDVVIRRGDASAVVRHFHQLVRHAAKNFRDIDSERGRRDLQK